MKPLIGIGLITYNRPKAATEVAKAIVNTLDHDKFDYKLVCSLDQEDTTGYETLPSNFILIPHPNVGISVNKSVAMMHLQECDHVFLFEDDLKPIKMGWDSLYVNLHNESGIGLFNYITSDLYYCDKRAKTEHKFKSGKVAYGYTHTAQIMSITKKTLNTVGALDPRFKGYGYEHCDYTRRCVKAGLHPMSKYPFVKQTWEYTEMLNIPNTTSDELRKQQIAYNGRIYNSTLERILIPFTEIEEFMKGKM